MASLKEQRAYKAIKGAAVGRLNCNRVENQVGDGMSDFVVQSHYGLDIWLEIKALDAHPVRPSTQWLRGEFRPGQLAFLREKISWGGHAFVLLRVNRDWWLLDPTNDPESIRACDYACVITQGHIEGIIEYLENLKHEDCPYAAPNYRPGTLQRKAKLCVSDGTGHG